MLTDTRPASSRRKPFASRIVRITLAASVALLAAGLASAQYPGGGTGGTGGTCGGTSTPSGDYGNSGKAIGIGVGAAAGAGLLFLAMHKSSVTGCVQPAEDGLRFVDEKKNTSYALVTGDVLLKAGQRVQLRGSKASGVQTFTAKKLVKDLGSCDTTTPAAAPPSTSADAKPSQP
jgi:hypothetical protein